jgi:hypothetical protein
MQISTWKHQDTPSLGGFNYILARGNQKHKQQPVQFGSKKSQVYLWQAI